MKVLFILGSVALVAAVAVVGLGALGLLALGCGIWWHLRAIKRYIERVKNYHLYN